MMELKEIDNVSDQVQAIEVNEDSDEVLMAIVLSFFLSFGAYAFMDQIFGIQLILAQVIFIALSMLSFLSLIGIYYKAGQPAWAAFIPVYGLIVMLRIIEKPIWWLFLILIPGVNVVYQIWMINLLSLKFGKDSSFTAGLILLPFIFYPILAYGPPQYIGKKQ